jgi:hypothetical protein
MQIDKGPEKVRDILKSKQAGKKPPAYQWQELALRVIEELSIPNFKRNAVFKVCKENPKPFIEKCLDDTKELCQTGQKWKYFFKLISANK